MEIIQQKLVWFMGSCAALILLYKLKLGRAGLRKSTLARMRAGVIMLMFGSLWGILLKTLFASTEFSSSGTAFSIETILGYTIGWALMIWGLVSWAASYFDLRGKPLTTAGSRVVSDIIMKSMLRGNGGKLLFNSFSRELFSILNCQGLTFHKIPEDDRLQLAFHQGLTESSAKLLEFPRGSRNVFVITVKSRQAVISDENHTLHEFSFPETSRGQITATISIPVTYNGQLLGVLTAYRIKNIPFNEDDLKVLEIAGSGLGASLQREKADKEYIQETRYKELLTIATKSLDTGQPMISALIKSAKTINNYLPFKWISLYVVGNGTPRSYEFNIPTGGAVKIIEGWFPKYAFPHLYNRDPNTGLKFNVGAGKSSRKTTYIFPVGNVSTPPAYLEFELQTPLANDSFLPLLANIMGKRFALYLKNDETRNRINTFKSWLGALTYFQEKAAEVNDVSMLLKEIASSTVDLVPTSFCRILLADPARRFLKTATLAQKRNLDWRMRFESKISLSNLEFHKTSLESGEVITFNQEDNSRKLSEEETFKMLPSEVKCGAIVPLALGQKTVGLITIGDCRKAGRAFENSDPLQFLAALSSAISMILTWHKEKRLSREGDKKLTLLKKSAKKESESEVSASRINSRINGPLAGIIAACEYLKSGLHTEKDDLDRYLNLIERSASQIHQHISSP
ncbi:MAG: GAF domain-containing protein [Candidatus Zixiibacteriota bacterium]|nr:MAG: GAF domain-containing protein [candidate division Zixibacteria bacterium]